MLQMIEWEDFKNPMIWPLKKQAFRIANALAFIACEAAVSSSFMTFVQFKLEASFQIFDSD